jgi:hypothetical protein
MSLADCTNPREEEQSEDRDGISKRKYSNKGVESSKDGEDSANTASPSPHSAPQSTEPNFKRYLVEDLKPPAYLDESKKLKETFEIGPLLASKRRSAAARRGGLPQDNHVEMQKKILQMQNKNKEESRKKTYANVYRALIGNVVICGGTRTACLAFIGFGNPCLNSKISHLCDA